MSEPTWNKKPLASALPRAWALEPRLMFDAAAVATAVEHAADAAARAVEARGAAAQEAHAQTAHDSAVAHAVDAAPAARREVVFVDSGITDYQALLRALPAGAEVVMLDAHRDGFAQMAQHLQGRQGLDAIHLISEGDRGAVHAGSTVLDLGTLSTHAADLQRIGAALGDNGDLLLYGCNVGEGVQGAALLDRVATLTRADIAASTDWSGNAARGADWELEARVGSVETAVAIDLQRVQGFGEVLGASSAITSAAYDATTGVLTVTGTNFTAGESIDVTKLTIKGQGSVTYALTSGSTATVLDGTTFRVTLGATDKTQIDKLFNKNGTTSLGNNPDNVSGLGTNAPVTYNIAAATGWAGAAVADLTGNVVNVSGLAAYTPLVFDSTIAGKFVTIAGSGTGKNNGDIMLYKDVVTGVDAVVTTVRPAGVAFTSDTDAFDSKTAPGAALKNFQPLINVSTAGSGITFKFDFYKSGTYTAPGTGTSATLYNVLLNSYDIDGAGTAGFQYQDFKGFTRYELSTGTQLTSEAQTDGSVRFQSKVTSNNSNLYNGDYRVRVYYDSMSSFEIKTGVAVGTGTAHFSLEFNVGPDWTTATNATESPVPRLSYSTTSFSEAAANNGSITATSTITLTNGTFSGSDGAVLSGVSFGNVPAGLTAVVTRVDSTHATLSFTGTATAHANANDLSNVTVTFGDAAFSTLSGGGTASSVTGATRNDLSIDFADPAASAPPVAGADSFTVNEDASNVSLDLLGNDTDADTPSLGLSIKSINGTTLTPGTAQNIAVTNGTVHVSAAGAVSFTPAANYNGTVSFSYVVTDGTSDATGAVTITVEPVNDAPTITAPASIAVTEDVTQVLSGISFADVDAASGSVSVTLNVNRGTLAATAGGSVAVSGSGTGSLTLTGTLAAINTFIANGVGYTTANNDASNATLSIGIDDGGNTGTGGNKTAAATVALNVTAVNDAPAVTAPASIAVTEDVAQVLTGISFADVDAASGTVSVTLSANRGTLAATAAGGVAVAGSGTGSLTLTGTLADINAFVAGGVSYTTASNDAANATLSIGIDDGGNTGSGGNKTAAATVALNVTAVNDAPVANDDAFTVAEDSAGTVLNLLGNDTDIDGGALRVSSINGTAITAGTAYTIAVTNGTVNVSTAGVVTFTPAANYSGTVS
ncbi:DUF4347 domain-containing protein, partial [Azohydromonas caseinilytica]